MLRLTGRVADGWLPSYGYLESLDAFARMNDLIDEGAERAGRNPADIRRWLNIGAADATVDRLVELAVDHGTSGFILAGDDATAMERFMGEVAPAVRGRVASARRH